MLPFVRPLTLLFATLLTLSSLAACTADEEQPAPVVAAELPDDLCVVVPETMLSRWNLEPASHETDNGEDLSTAACTMTGEIAGDPVELELSLRAFGASDEDAADELAGESLDESCAELESQSADGRGHRGGGRVHVAVAGDARGDPGPGAGGVAGAHLPGCRPRDDGARRAGSGSWCRPRWSRSAPG